LARFFKRCPKLKKSAAKIGASQGAKRLAKSSPWLVGVLKQQAPMQTLFDLATFSQTAQRLE